LCYFLTQFIENTKLPIGDADVMVVTAETEVKSKVEADRLVDVYAESLAVI
jgi:hypothetical protein